MKPGVGEEMRNYELIKEIYKIANVGSKDSTFKNSYLNDIIAISKLIGKERPEILEIEVENV